LLEKWKLFLNNKWLINGDKERESEESEIGSIYLWPSENKEGINTKVPLYSFVTATKRDQLLTFSCSAYEPGQSWPKSSLSKSGRPRSHLLIPITTTAINSAL
jgi:hypothetical protein